MKRKEDFLADIIAEPDADAPRLIYADWLEEQGERDRAEFIRLQCQLYDHQGEREWLEQMPVEQWRGDEAEGKLLRKLDPLVQRHTELCHLYVRNCAAWSREFIESLLGPNYLQLSAAWQWGWTRGFIAEITLPCADWLAHREEILRMCPLEKVKITKYAIGPRDEVDHIARSLIIHPTEINHGNYYPPLPLKIRKGALFLADHATLFGFKDWHVVVEKTTAGSVFDEILQRWHRQTDEDFLRGASAASLPPRQE